MRGISIAGIALAIATGPVQAQAQCQAPAIADLADPDTQHAPLMPIEREIARALERDVYADSAGQAQALQALLARLGDEERLGGGVDVRWRIRGQTRLARTLDYSDQAGAARVEGERALDLIARHGFSGTELELEARIVMATVLADNEALDAAAGDARRALELAISLHGARSGQASHAHNALGTVAYGRGHYIEAEREYGRAAELALACQALDDPAVVNQLASHAGTLFMIGRIEAALGEARRATNRAARYLPEDSPVQTLALGNLGALLLTTGRYAEAVQALRRVVDLEATYQHESWYYRSISLSNYATALRHTGRLEESEALWLAANELRKKASIGRDPSSVAFPMRYAADAAQERGDLVLARTRRDEAVRMIEAVTSPEDPERARTHLERAQTLFLQGEAASALAEASNAIAVLRQRYEETDTRRMSAEIAFARILAANGRLEEAYALGHGVAARLETRLLDSATGRGDLVHFGPAFALSFSTMTELALRSGRDEEAFRYLQLANMSDVVVVTNEVAARAGVADPASSALVRAYQDRLRRRQALESESSFALAKGQNSRAGDLAEQIATNDRYIAELGARLDREVPRLRDLGRPAPVALGAYRARLRPDEALLAPLLLPDATLAIVVTRQGLSWQRTPLRRADALARIRDLRESVDPHAVAAVGTGTAPFAYQAARDLYAAFLPDGLSATLGPVRDLIYFAGGDLAGFPPALLIASDGGLGDGGPGVGRLPQEGGDAAKIDWLIRRYSVRIAPSLLPTARVGPRRAGAPRFLGVGAPLLAPPGDPREAGRLDLSDLAPLPGAERELRALASLFGARQSMVLSGARASKSALGALQLEDYAVVTFATHGLAGAERRGLDEPALLLSPERGGQDEGGGDDARLLTASQIMQFRLDADWVILSACNTAQGSGAGAPIFSGLAAAFLHAGARALLVSHWPVRDDVAAQIVVAAVRSRAQGMRAARALQAAQLALIEGKAGPGRDEPALWGALVLVQP